MKHWGWFCSSDHVHYLPRLVGSCVWCSQACFMGELKECMGKYQHIAAATEMVYGIWSMFVIFKVSITTNGKSKELSKECIIDLNKSGESLEVISKEWQVQRSTVQTVVSKYKVHSFTAMIRKMQSYYLLLKEIWCSTESKWNNEEGEFSPFSLRQPKNPFHQNNLLKDSSPFHIDATLSLQQ